MSELKNKLLAEYDGQQVGGDILCRHPVSGVMMVAARPDGEGGFEETVTWKQARRDAAAEAERKADVDKLADEALQKEVQARAAEKAAEAAAAAASEQDVAEEEIPVEDEEK